MTIAHIVCRFPPYSGGMGVVAYEQVTRLTRQGHQVTVFTLATKPKLDSNKLPFNIKYLKALPRMGNAGFSPELFWQLRDYNIIHFHYPFYGAQEVIWLGKITGLYKKSKLIIWYHMDATFKNIFAQNWHWRTWLIQRNLLKQADKICCASLDYIKHSKIKKLYQKYPDKFIQIPFGTNQNPNQVNQTALKDIKKKLNIQAHHKVILFVGGLDSAHYFKGVPILIDAIHKLNNKNIKLIIVGDGNLRDDFERQVNGLNLTDQVIFTGQISSEDLPNYYHLCHLTVLPSTTQAEAFGLVLVEAKTFGKPVIGSDLPGVRDVIGQAGLTVKPGDSNDLADKIRTLLNDKFLYNRYSHQALKDVEGEYNWPQHIQKLIEVYNH